MGCVGAGRFSDNGQGGCSSERSWEALTPHTSFRGDSLERPPPFSQDRPSVEDAGCEGLRPGMDREDCSCGDPPKGHRSPAATAAGDRGPSGGFARSTGADPLPEGAVQRAALARKGRPGAMRSPDPTASLYREKLGMIQVVGHRRIPTRGIGWKHLQVATYAPSRNSCAERLPDEMKAATAAFFQRTLSPCASQGLRIQRIFTTNGRSLASPSERRALVSPGRRAAGAVGPMILNQRSPRSS